MQRWMLRLLPMRRVWATDHSDGASMKQLSYPCDPAALPKPLPRKVVAPMYFAQRFRDHSLDADVWEVSTRYRGEPFTIQQIVTDEARAHGWDNPTNESRLSDADWDNEVRDTLDEMALDLMLDELAKHVPVLKHVGRYREGMIL